MLPFPDTQRTCTAPAGRRLLLRYASRGASEAEERAFESHILECDLCYEDFLAVWRTTEIVAEWPTEARDQRSPARGPETPVLPPPTQTTARTERWRLFGWGFAGLLVGFALGTCA